MGRREEALMLFENLQKGLREARERLDDVIANHSALDPREGEKTKVRADALWLSTVRTLEGLSPELFHLVLDGAGFETTPPYKRKLQS